MKKVLSRMYTGVVVLFLLWFAISYLDIITHNLTTQSYLSFNLLTLVMQVG